MLPTILNDLWMTCECLLATDLYVLLRQERPLLRESAGILQNAWWENWKGKKKQKKQRSTSSPEHFVTLHDGAEWQKWRIIPSLGPNLSERGHNRWQNSDSKQKQSVGWAKAWVFWAQNMWRWLLQSRSLRKAASLLRTTETSCHFLCRRRALR